MTRFARAKGSKASNERLPEEATSWQAMKQQIEEKKQEVAVKAKRKEIEAARKINYEKFLEEIDERNEVKWAKFTDDPGASVTQPKKTKRTVKVDGNTTATVAYTVSKSPELVETVEAFDDDDSDASPAEVTAKAEPEAIASSKLKKPKKSPIQIDVNLKTGKTDFPELLMKWESVKLKKKQKKQARKSRKAQEVKEKPAEELTDGDLHLIEKKKQRRLRQAEKRRRFRAEKRQQAQGSQAKVSETEGAASERNGNDAPNRGGENYAPKKHGVANTDKNRKLAKKPAEELTEKDLLLIERKKQRRLRQAEKRSRFSAEKRQQAEGSQAEASDMGGATSEVQTVQNGAPYLGGQNYAPEERADRKRKLPKARDDKEHKRRKPVPEETTININGVEVALAYFGGFPVKKEDAKRLYGLKKQMRHKGIPRSEIAVTLKLERRKAEKALAREKKKLCFNCRKSGHELSECPDLGGRANEEAVATDVCLKCGSAEHKHFECKVVRGQEYKFARCFICHEEGHISRQCPDNPRGIYPKGGACKVCGDVTHLKKDCPKYREEQESAAVTLDTLNVDNVEALQGERSGDGGIVRNVKHRKIVKF